MPTMTLSFTGNTVAVLVSPFFGSPVDDLPFLVARLGVESDQRGVGLVMVNRAVGVSGAAVHRVATHHRDDRRILFRLVLPQDLAIFVQIEGVDGVGEG